MPWNDRCQLPIEVYRVRLTDCSWPVDFLPFSPFICHHINTSCAQTKEVWTFISGIFLCYLIFWKFGLWILFQLCRLHFLSMRGRAIYNWPTPLMPCQANQCKRCWSPSWARFTRGRSKSCIGTTCLYPILVF